MIADLTYSRPSVYWEAGFAERITPVVYMARRDHFSPKSPEEDPHETTKIHFDLVNANIIPWSETSFLSTRKTLSRRLKLVSRPFEKERKENEKLRDQRQEFSALSLMERNNLVNEVLESCLVKANYRYKKNLVAKIADGIIEYERREKILDDTFLRIHTLACRQSLTKTLLQYVVRGNPRRYGEKGLLASDFSSLNSLPGRIQRLGKAKKLKVRNIWLISTLTKIPSRTIDEVMPNFRRGNEGGIYYRTFFPIPPRWENNFTEDDTILPTSEEIVFVDQILSIAELSVHVRGMLSHLEEFQASVIRPRI